MTQAPIVLFDTLTGKKQELETLQPGKCGVYCCGPTVYGLSHLGNARAALVPDVIVRFLRHEGYDVKYVRNITDIDDKIIQVGQAEDKPAQEVADHFVEEYRKDVRDLNILEPDVEPRVSGHLEQIVDMISSLVDKGLAYAVNGDVYFRVQAFQPYGKLSKRNVEEMLEGAGSRVDVDERKESPLDFALWKSAKPGEPAWESPWGPGRPGWHIECSAMSSAHLGQSFDIHCGGRDLIFPHHENEIAQSQGCHGEGTFSKYWVHNGFIDFAGEKMSKSLGNFFTTREITRLYDPETVRYFLLTVHYRSGLNFEVEIKCPGCEAHLTRAEQDSGQCGRCQTETPREVLRQRVRFPGVEDADDRMAYIYQTLLGCQQFLAPGKAPEGAPEVSELVSGMLPAFTKRMRQDFNTSGALGTLSKPLAEVNSLLSSSKGVSKAYRHGSIARFQSDMMKVAEIFGCFGQDPADWLLRRRDQKASRVGLDIAEVDRLVDERVAARTAKDWARADELRAELAQMGVGVQDGPEGSTWSFL